MTTSQAPNARELAPLMHAVAAGDRNALADLYGRTSGKLYGICIRLLGSEPEAEDVLQDVYLTVWNKAGSFDRDKASPITWLAVLARNKSIDRLRRQRAPTTTLDDAPDLADDAPSVLEVLEQDEDRRRLNSCLDELEEQQRASIRAAFLDGATYPQLAEREQVPLGTMKSWIRRGLIRLRGCLER
ncbi:MAG: sigma-70 family RNA polymerase sigma factor [Sphingomonas sp.]|jgi:RNA polymerase sigma-70 factor (ECF subfamily)|nr:sigma-70 family RNA polymerase sigma factor [Sphingomonas sp.]